MYSFYTNKRKKNTLLNVYLTNLFDPKNFYKNFVFVTIGFKRLPLFLRFLLTVRYFAANIFQAVDM